MDTLLPQIARLLAAALLGGAVGLQRERDRHPAGLRTHMLVAVGSALMTLVSDSYPGSDGRVAAQVVSGIGFLGAGTIIRDGANVKGLTTAASLWAVAGLGIAVGRGGNLLVLGLVTTIVMLLTLSVVDVLEDRYIARTGRRTLLASLAPESLPAVYQALVEHHVQILTAIQGRTDSTGAQQVSLRLAVPRGISPEGILRNLMHVGGVRHVRWDDGQEVETDV